MKGNDTEAVAKVRSRLGSLGDRAKATFRTKTRPEQGLTTTAKIRRLDLTIDEPAADVPAGLSQLRFGVRIESSAPAERIAELARRGERHRPVLDVIQRPVPISGAVTLNGAALEARTG